MGQVEVKVPDIGGASGVEVIEVCVKSGDRVAIDQSLIVLESDKATMEIPSPQAGVVGDILLKLGDKVSEGDVIVTLLDESPAAETQSDAASASGRNSVPALATGGEAVPESVVPSRNAADSAAATRGQSQDVLVPDLGGARDVTVIELSVAVGDEVGREQSLIVLESDKATMEIPSPFAGRVAEILVAVGSQVSEGDLICRLLVEGGDGKKAEGGAEGSTVAAVASAESAVSDVASTAAKDDMPRTLSPAIGQADRDTPTRVAPDRVASDRVASDRVAPTSNVGGREPVGMVGERKVHAGPAVRRLAREFGVDLALVSGSGMKGRVIKEDVQRFVKQGMQQVQAGTVAVPGAAYGLPIVELPDFSEFGPVERRQMSRLQRLTADSMVRSWLTAPQVTQFDEADVTDLESFRRDQQVAGEKRGVKLTTLPFILKACAHALAALPQFNVSLDPVRNEIIQKRYIHIGVAVDTPAGLVVPVIRDVPGKGLWDLAKELADLAARARERKLKPAEMQGGCFTVSSLGSIGGTAFTPIVNVPEVAILGLSRAQYRPVYQGGQFVPRLLLPLSLSYDHRAINGAEAARFTALLAETLGDLRRLLL